MSGSGMFVIDLIKDIFKNNKTNILIGAGVAGTGIAMYSTAKAAIATDHEISDKEQRTGVPLTNKEKVKIFLKHGWKGLAIEAASAACIIKGASDKDAAYAEVGALLATTRAGFAEYKEAMKKRLGNEEESRISKAIANKDSKKEEPAPAYIACQDDKVLMYETWSKRYFYSTVNDVNAIMNDINFRNLTEMFVPMNDFFYDLGLEQTAEGSKYGFCVDDGPVKLRFVPMKTENNKAALAIEYPYGNEPRTEP